MTPAMLAQASDAVQLLGAVGTFVTVVGGALGGWWLRIKQQNATAVLKKAEADRLTAETALATKRADTADERRQRKDEITELYRIIALKDKDHEDNRNEIHKIRDTVQPLTAKLAAAEVRLELCERERVNLAKRIEALENDRG